MARTTTYKVTGELICTSTDRESIFSNTRAKFELSNAPESRFFGVLLAGVQVHTTRRKKDKPIRFVSLWRLSRISCWVCISLMLDFISESGPCLIMCMFFCLQEVYLPWDIELKQYI